MDTIYPSYANASPMEVGSTREISPNIVSFLNVDLVFRGLFLLPIMNSSGCDDFFFKVLLD